MKFVERLTSTETVVSYKSQQEHKRCWLRTLVSKVGSEWLVEEEWQVLNPDNLESYGYTLDCTRWVTTGHTY